LAKLVDGKSPAKVVLDISKTIGQSKIELSYRVGSRLSNVIATNRYCVVITNFMATKILLHIPHQLESEFQ